MMPRADPDYLTPAEVAQRWRVHVSTVYRLLEQRKLTHYLIEGSKRIRRTDVEAYETAGRVEAFPQPVQVRGMFQRRGEVGLMPRRKVKGA